MFRGLFIGIGATGSIATMRVIRLLVGVVFLGLMGCADKGTDSLEGPDETSRLIFTHVPAYGGLENLEGRVRNVLPESYKIAVYIYVGGWWTKPFFSTPLTDIHADGSWTCDITTGGIDEQATRIRAYLVPDDYDPPLMGGEANLPAVLDSAAIDNFEEIRKPLVREVAFSGYKWEVKSSKIPVGPGPNHFSDRNENVWVDKQGRLHLAITNRDGKWYCAEVVSEESFGYGTYRFSLSNRTDLLDQNIVVGLFTWDDPADHHREVDIELSRWGQPTNDNAQFVVQPWERAENIYRFDAHLMTDLSTHSFTWRSEEVSFLSLQGHHTALPNGDSVIASWSYTKQDIPNPGMENARINLWLLNGEPPSDLKRAEVIISKFEFVP